MINIKDYEKKDMADHFDFKTDHAIFKGAFYFINLFFFSKTGFTFLALSGLVHILITFFVFMASKIQQLMRVQNRFPITIIK